MSISFYYAPTSGPCRAVLLTARALRLKLNCINVNILANEQLKPEFIKINPQHTVPTIDDNGFYLWESRSIMTYLVSKYGKNDSLYPKDAKQRGIVDQRLYFELGMYHTFTDCYYPVFLGLGGPDPEKLKKIEEQITLLDTFVENSEYAAGAKLTVADFSLVALISVFDIVGIDISPYKNVTRWYAKVRGTAPGFEEIMDKDAILSHLEKIKQILNQNK